MKKTFPNLLHRLNLGMLLLAGAITARCIARHRPQRKPVAVLIKLDHLGDVLISLQQILRWEQEVRETGRQPMLLLHPDYRKLVRETGYSGMIFPLDPLRFFQKKDYVKKILHRLNRLQASEIINLVPQGYAELFAAQIGGRAVYTGYRPERQDRLTQLAQICSHYREKRLLVMDRTLSIYKNEAQLLSKALDLPIAPEAADLSGLFPQAHAVIPHAGRYYLVAPGSSDLRRTWPESSWSALLLKLHERFPDFTPVIVGSRAEREFAERILQALPPGTPAVNYTGQTDWESLTALLRKAAWLLSNDCGILHLAGLMHVPATGIVGLGHWGCFFPNPEFYPSIRIVHASCSFANCQWRCHFDDFNYRCIANITPGTVMQEVLALRTPSDRK